MNQAATTSPLRPTVTDVKVNVWCIQGVTEIWGKSSDASSKFQNNKYVYMNKLWRVWWYKPLIRRVLVQMIGFINSWITHSLLITLYYSTHIVFTHQTSGLHRATDFPPPHLTSSRELFVWNSRELAAEYYQSRVILPPRRSHRKLRLHCCNVFTVSLLINGRGADRSKFIVALLVAQ
jgi:hypothetical protein